MAVNEGRSEEERAELEQLRAEKAAREQAERDAAERAEAAADRAEQAGGSALPPMTPADAGSVLAVNADGDGYAFLRIASDAETAEAIRDAMEGQET